MSSSATSKCYANSCSVWKMNWTMNEPLQGSLPDECSIIESLSDGVLK